MTILEHVYGSVMRQPRCRRLRKPQRGTHISKAMQLEGNIVPDSHRKSMEGFLLLRPLEVSSFFRLLGRLFPPLGRYPVSSDRLRFPLDPAVSTAIPSSSYSTSSCLTRESLLAFLLELRAPAGLAGLSVASWSWRKTPGLCCRSQLYTETGFRNWASLSRSADFSWPFAPRVLVPWYRGMGAWPLI